MDFFFYKKGNCCYKKKNCCGQDNITFEDKFVWMSLENDKATFTYLQKSSNSSCTDFMIYGNISTFETEHIII